MSPDNENLREHEPSLGDISPTGDSRENNPTGLCAESAFEVFGDPCPHGIHHEGGGEPLITVCDWCLLARNQEAIRLRRERDELRAEVERLRDVIQEVIADPAFAKLTFKTRVLLDSAVNEQTGGEHDA